MRWASPAEDIAPVIDRRGRMRVRVAVDVSEEVVSIL
jgi:hypothetical protein